MDSTEATKPLCEEDLSSVEKEHRHGLLDTLGLARRFSKRIFDLPVDVRMTITPELANRLIQFQSRLVERYSPNPIQRPFSHATAARYATDLVAGTWHGTVATLTYSWDGRLLDGQHRLYAIRKASVPVDGVCVSLDHDPETLADIDQNRPRSMQSALVLSGLCLDATSTLVGIAKILAFACGRTGIEGRRISPAHAASVFDRYADGIAFATTHFGGKRLRAICVAAVMSAVVKAFYHIEEGKRDRLALFCQILTETSMPSGEKDRAAAALRTLLLSAGRARLDNFSRWQDHLKTQVAISAFLRGEARHILRVPEAELYPVTEAPEVYGMAIEIEQRDSERPA